MTIEIHNLIEGSETLIGDALDEINGEVIATTSFDKMEKIAETKLAIETVIENANIGVPVGTKFSDYPDYVADAVAKAKNEALFDFRTDTKTLLPYCYNSYVGPTDVVIPSSINGIAVENIAASAFVFGVIDKRGITSVYIPDSVKTIGATAFTNNPIGAVRLSTNAAFTIISVSAFNSGSGTMIEIEIPDNITTIQQYGFAFQPIIKIIIGAGVDIFFDATYPTMGAYGADFKVLYDGNGKLAGTYEYTAGSWSKTA